MKRKRPMDITTQTLASELGCAPQTVNKYRRKAEAKAGHTFGRKSETDARVIVFTREEADLIKAIAPAQVTVTPVEAVVTDLVTPSSTMPEVDRQGLSVTLLPLESPVPAQFRTMTFDHNDAASDRKALVQHQSYSVQGANTLLSSYARTRMSQAVATIDRTIETMTANALAAAGAQAGEDTQATQVGKDDSA